MGGHLVNGGDLVLCDFGDPIGHEPAFRRPAVVLSATAFNRNGTLIVAPITRTQRGYPTQVELEGPLPVTSYVQCELIRAVSEQRIIRPLGRISEPTMKQIATILRRIMSL